MSLIQSLQWASRIVDELFPEEHNRLARWFQTGCLVKSNYSGIGCAELAFANLQKALKMKLGDGVWVPPIRLVECADTDKQCRQVLQAQGPPCTTPERCFGDILARLPLIVRQQLAAIRWPSKKDLLQNGRAKMDKLVNRKINKVLDLFENGDAVSFNTDSLAMTTFLARTFAWRQSTRASSTANAALIVLLARACGSWLRA